MRGKSSTGLNVGGSSILVIFVLLCLTTFATLSMVSANADYKLTLKTAEASSRFYEADSAAEQRLAEIDDILIQAQTSSTDIVSYYLSVNASLMLTDLANNNDFFMMELLNTAEDGSISNTLPPFTLSYAVPINEQQELSVSLEVLYPATADAPRYQILTWAVVNTASLDEFWEEEPLNLFTGEWS